MPLFGMIVSSTLRLPMPSDPTEKLPKMFPVFALRFSVDAILPVTLRLPRTDTVIVPPFWMFLNVVLLWI